MNKEKLKLLIDEIYKNLFESVSKNETLTKENIANYLYETAHIVSDLNYEDINSDELIKSVFAEAYKDLAKESISNFKDTNQKFDEINVLHEEALSECHQENADLEKVKEKLDQIQKMMFSEVEQANKKINLLTSQVKNLETKSNLDPLTKIYNRRAMTKYLTNLCSKKEAIKDFYLLIIDIDDFKVINDTYGHIAGDKILIFISNLLKKTLRDSDKIFRFGGEEFIITLNRISEEECLKVAKRLLSLVSKNKLIYKNKSLSVTVSLGISNFIKNDTPDSFIARADNALYEAKKGGKNQMHSGIINGI